MRGEILEPGYPAAGRSCIRCFHQFEDGETALRIEVPTHQVTQHIDWVECSDKAECQRRITKSFQAPFFTSREQYVSRFDREALLGSYRAPIWMPSSPFIVDTIA